ncbi:MAG: GNAT family N-acetyltransferase [Lactobacillales bacterium]|nr:GNAT family N-acetyltransferase [Lactobacillales bacterium]
MQVLILSCVGTLAASPIPIPAGLLQKMKRALAYTQSLVPDFKINSDEWILYALVDGVGDTIGTVVVAEDRHIGGTVHLEYIAIRADHQGKGHGRVLMKDIFKEVGRRTEAKRAILSTDLAGSAFYRAIGMQPAGEIKIENSHRYLFWEKL